LLETEEVHNLGPFNFISIKDIFLGQPFYLNSTKDVLFLPISTLASRTSRLGIPFICLLIV